MSTRLSFLNMLWVSGPRCCLLLPRHHTSDRAWQLHHQWSRGSIPFGRSAPVNGQCGSLAPLGGYRWHQSHRSVWTLLTILTYQSLPVGEEAAVSGGEALHFTPFMPGRCVNRLKKWQLGQNLENIFHKPSVFQEPAHELCIGRSDDFNSHQQWQEFNFQLFSAFENHLWKSDKAININCRWRPQEHCCSIHLFEVMLVKMINLCTNICL